MKGLPASRGVGDCKRYGEYARDTKLLGADYLWRRMERSHRIPVIVGIVAVVGALVVVGIAAQPWVAAAQFDGNEFGENQSAPFAPPDMGSAERLVLFGEDPGIAQANPAVDPGLATSNEFEQLVMEWETELFELALDEKSTSEEKVAVLEDQMESLQTDVDTLNEREEAAYRAFESGEIGPDEFVARLAVLEKEGQHIGDRLETVRHATRGITSPVVQDNVTRIQATVGWLQLETETFEGPIRSTTWETIIGENREGPSITVHATPGGYVLSTTDGIMYTREIYHGMNHQRGAGGFLSTDEGGERIQALYPWTYAESFEQDPRVRGDIFREILTHPHGTTTTYLDGTTELPYREIHELDLAAIPTEPAASQTTGDIRVTLERTYAGGPAHVVVTTTDDEPVVDATVEIDERKIVATNDDGVAWFTTTGEEVTVIVSTAEAEVELTAQLPIGTPAIG